MSTWPLTRWIVEACREWTWRHTAVGVLIGLLTMTLFNYASITGGIDDDAPYLAWAIWNVVQFGWPYVLAMRVADRAVADGLQRGLAYGVALAVVLVGGCSVFAAPVSLLFDIMGGPPPDTSGSTLAQRFTEYAQLDVNLLITRLPAYVLFTACYAQWRREQRSRARLHAAAVERAERERLLQASRLLALQARIEPQFLFDALRRVRALIEQSTEAADRLLADLIVLLRALQPPVGAKASTVGREFALVDAYARVSGSLPGQSPRLSLAASPKTVDASLAPMILLPTIRSLAGASPSHWHVTAEREGERLTLTVAAPQPDEAARGALSGLDTSTLRERLITVHGTDARLSLDTDAARLSLDLPLHHDDPSPDR